MQKSKYYSDYNMSNQDNRMDEKPCQDLRLTQLYAGEHTQIFIESGSFSRGYRRPDE